MRLMTERSKLTLPASMKYLGAASAYVRELAREAGFDDQSAASLCLAFDETAANIVRHGYNEDSSATYELVCEMLPAGLALVFRDKGAPFDPGRIPEYAPDRVSADADTSGLGTFLVKHFVDETAWINRGREGHETRLVKHLPNRRIDQCLSAGELAPYSEEKPAHRPEIPDFDIRPMKPEEAIEVSLCAWKAYGYTYEDYIYYPERIVEMNRVGEMCSLVAVTREGTLMGHCGIKRDAPGSPTAELGVLFIKPEFRGAKVARALSLALLAMARGMGMSSLYVRAVTSHVISQKLALEMGSVDTAVMLGVFPSDVEFKSLVGHVRQKESGLLMCLALAPRVPRTVYIPPHHRETVRELYRASGFAICAAEAEAASTGPTTVPEEEPCVHVARAGILNVAFVAVASCGPRTVEEVRRSRRNLCLERVDVVFLYVPIERRDAPTLIGEMEADGFVFAGIHPEGIDGQDALVLQYLNNLALDLSAIRLASDHGNGLLDYIRRETERCGTDGGPKA